MDYAIIKSGATKLLEVVKLTDWQDYEWRDFSTVKNKTNREIEWFYDEKKAIEFMIEKFPKEMINPKYFKEESNDGEYYID